MLPRQKTRPHSWGRPPIEDVEVRSKGRHVHMPSTAMRRIPTQNISSLATSWLVTGSPGNLSGRVVTCFEVHFSAVLTVRCVDVVLVVLFLMFTEAHVEAREENSLSAGVRLLHGE